MGKGKKEPGNHVIRNRVFMGVTSVLLAAVIVGNVVLTNYADSIDAFIGTPEVQVSEEEMETNIEEASELASQIEAEGTVLLQNNDDTLPLSSDITKVNVFGWASTAWLSGGSGSGMVTHMDVDFLQALEDYGIEYNTELTDMYTDFQDGREYTGTLGSYPEESARLYEPSISDTDYYTESMLENGYSGLYAPATNMHRSPLDGRSYEYYSEDSLLSGEMCGNVVQGIQEMGVYCYVKHLVCNDGESGIYRDSVYTWMTEQTLREVYLEPFRMLVEDEESGREHMKELLRSYEERKGESFDVTCYEDGRILSITIYLSGLLILLLLEYSLRGGSCAHRCRRFSTRWICGISRCRIIWTTPHTFAGSCLT